MNFLFWNCGCHPVSNVISDLAQQLGIDIIVLAEVSEAPLALLAELNGKAGGHYRPTISQCEYIQIYTRFSETWLSLVSEDTRYTIRRLRVPGKGELLLVAAHLVSALHANKEDRNAGCTDLAYEIRRIEAQVGHSKTILVGDLNVDPFDAGIVNANGLHGVMSRQIARKRSRIVRGREYPFFYNPMWSLYGDLTNGPPGTYYYRPRDHNAYFWHMFDQVLVRPDLIAAFRHDKLRIVEAGSSRSLLSQSGIPDGKQYSDHLPLVFEIEI